jgi:hypothetical protein
VSKTINSPNNSIAFKNLTDAHGSLNGKFKASAKEHNDTYASILNHIGDKSTANKRIKAVKEKVAKENSSMCTDMRVTVMMTMKEPTLKRTKSSICSAAEYAWMMQKRGLRMLLQSLVPGLRILVE